MTNPFNRADKHGAPDMRPTAPASAEKPMRPITIDNVQFMTAAEQVEHGHRTRGEPTYAELQAINAELLGALERIMRQNIIPDYWTCFADANHAIAKAKIACG